MLRTHFFYFHFTKLSVVTLSTFTLHWYPHFTIGGPWATVGGDGLRGWVEEERDSAEEFIWDERELWNLWNSRFDNFRDWQNIKVVIG